MGKSLKLTRHDLDWLLENHPTLVPYQDGSIQCIQGQLIFCASFDQHNNQYFIHDPKYPPNPPIKDVIFDNYSIEIRFEPSYSSPLLQLKEVGGKIHQISKKYSKNIEDLHINLDGTACFHGVFGDLIKCFPNGFTVENLFNRLIIPYFYEQSFFEINGYYPSDDYSHAFQGKLESLYDFIPKLSYYVKNEQQVNTLIEYLKAKKIKKSWPCICLSGLSFSSCHISFLKEIVNQPNFKALKKEHRLFHKK